MHLEANALSGVVDYRKRLEPLRQDAMPIGEQRVVQVIEMPTVSRHARDVHAQPIRHLLQGEAEDASIAEHLPRDRDDLGSVRPRSMGTISGFVLGQ
jgi:hypothetical protein